jgi:hypothetical protein
MPPSISPFIHWSTVLSIILLFPKKISYFLSGPGFLSGLPFSIQIPFQPVIPANAVTGVLRTPAAVPATAGFHYSSEP